MLTLRLIMLWAVLSLVPAAPKPHAETDSLCEIGGDYSGEVGLVNVQTGEERWVSQLILAPTQRVSPSIPRWLPDGRRLLVQAQAMSPNALLIVDAFAQSEALVIADNVRLFNGSSLARDGTMVVYATHVPALGPPDNQMVLVSLVDGTLATLDPFDGTYSFPSLSPDGIALTFRVERRAMPFEQVTLVHHTTIHPRRQSSADRIQLWRMNVDGTDLQLLAQGPSSAHWSPDGMRLALLQTVNGVRSLHVQEADGRIRQLVVGDFGDLDWSPDGTHLAAVLPYTSSFIEHTKIVIIDVEDGRITELTDGLSADLHPSWSPTGQQLAFLTNRVDELYIQMWLMNADGSGQRPIIERPGLSGSHPPMWNPVTCADE